MNRHYIREDDGIEKGEELTLEQWLKQRNLDDDRRRQPDHCVGTGFGWFIVYLLAVAVVVIVLAHVATS